MLTQLNFRLRDLFIAVAIVCLAMITQESARAQDASPNDTVEQPAKPLANEESTAKPTDKKEADKPVDKEADKDEAEKKDLENKDADKKDAEKKEPEKKEPEKKEPEKKEPEKKEPEKKEPEKKDSEKKDADDKDAEKKETPSDDKQVKAPRRITGLGSFDGVQLRNQPWKIHDIRRPHPPVVTPGELSTYEKPGTAPSDAIVLFDGTNLSQWAHLDRELPDALIEAQWKVQDGYFEITPGFGSLQTLEGFGSCHLHIEWQAPAQVKGDGQNRGNSGIKFMSSFEVQILDSFNNRTYADGQAGSIYGQYPPMVNAARKPGEWQVYDILFIAPKFSLDGKLVRPASATVMHNGIFVQNAREYAGPSGAHGAMYSPLTPAAPIMLQDHGCPVRFRNVWARNIPDAD